MRFNFEDKPECIIVKFKSKRNNYCKKPLHIAFCTGLLFTMDTTVIIYRARDGKNHRHKYSNKNILFIAGHKDVFFHSPDFNL